MLANTSMLNIQTVVNILTLDDKKTTSKVVFVYCNRLIIKNIEKGGGLCGC
jgi:hypothetical protein